MRPSTRVNGRASYWETRAGAGWVGSPPRLAAVLYLPPHGVLCTMVSVLRLLSPKLKIKKTRVTRRARRINTDYGIYLRPFVRPINEITLLCKFVQTSKIHIMEISDSKLQYQTSTPRKIIPFSFTVFIFFYFLYVFAAPARNLNQENDGRLPE